MILWKYRMQLEELRLYFIDPTVTVTMTWWKRGMTFVNRPDTEQYLFWRRF